VGVREQQVISSLRDVLRLKANERAMEDECAAVPAAPDELHQGRFATLRPELTADDLTLAKMDEPF
jgi:hypothetical protein